MRFRAAGLILVGPTTETKEVKLKVRRFEVLLVFRVSGPERSCHLLRRAQVCPPVPLRLLHPPHWMSWKWNVHMTPQSSHWGVCTGFLLTARKCCMSGVFTWDISVSKQTDLWLSNGQAARKVHEHALITLKIWKICMTCRCLPHFPLNYPHVLTMTCCLQHAHRMKKCMNILLCIQICPFYTCRWPKSTCKGSPD